MTIAVAAGICMIVVAFVLAFIPLPTQSYGGQVAWCGPGTSSESAFFVRLDPNSVNSPGSFAGSISPLTGEQAADFAAFCVGVATTRLYESWAFLVPGLLMAVASTVLLTLRLRWMQDL